MRSKDQSHYGGRMSESHDQCSDRCAVQISQTISRREAEQYSGASKWFQVLEIPVTSAEIHNWPIPNPILKLRLRQGGHFFRLSFSLRFPWPQRIFHDLLIQHFGRNCYQAELEKWWNVYVRTTCQSSLTFPWLSSFFLNFLVFSSTISTLFHFLWLFLDFPDFQDSGHPVRVIFSPVCSNII